MSANEARPHIGKQLDKYITKHVLTLFSATLNPRLEFGRLYCDWEASTEQDLAATHSRKIPEEAFPQGLVPNCGALVLLHDDAWTKQR
eukprot:2470281-Amphidinium_carterae.1